MNQHRVHFVYLVPIDREPTAIEQIERAALHLQAWYQSQMDGKTFTLSYPVLKVCPTPHTSDWYSTNPHGEDQRGWYWANTLEDAAQLAGAGFYQEFDDWLVYVDAEPAHGQYSGGTSGGYTSGVAVLGARDLSALQGRDHEWSVCREIGGCGHELGHTFGLPHPDGSPNWNQALMGTGYGIYPRCILTDEDKARLNLNPFFELSARRPAPMGLCPFNDRRIPQRRPRPIPHLATR